MSKNVIHKRGFVMNIGLEPIPFLKIRTALHELTQQYFTKNNYLLSTI